MTCLRTYSKGIIIPALLAITFITCKKDITPVDSISLDNYSHQIVSDWNNLALHLIPKCNGFSEPITARSLYYANISLYESLRYGLTNYKSLDGRINGLKANLPKPDPGLEYNWVIVSSHMMDLVCSNLYKSSGSDNVLLIKSLREKLIKQFAADVSIEIAQRSIDLGKEMGWKMIDYSLTDGQDEAYLRNYPIEVYKPNGEGTWIPTPPDYNSKPLLPYWGSVRLSLEDNNDLVPSNKLKYSVDRSSLIFAEANEIYTKSKNLSAVEKEKVEYWNRYMDPHSSPVCHNFLLLQQLTIDKKLDLKTALETSLKLSIALHDGYIISWKEKFKSNFIRPSSYIKLNLDRFYIADVVCLSVPEYIAETAVLYRASSEILSSVFGYRTPFVDYTQIERNDLRESNKNFDSFYEMAKEAAYTDILAAVHFRSTINAGFEVGYDLAQNVMKISLN